MTNLELIAKLAGVSRGTVDRVLHNRGQVRPETEEKVRAVMQELDFQPNALGQASTCHERKQDRHSVAFREPDFRSRSCRGVNEGVVYAQQHGVEVLIEYAHPDDTEGYLASLRRLLDGRRSRTRHSRRPLRRDRPVPPGDFAGADADRCLQRGYPRQRSARLLRRAGLLPGRRLRLSDGTIRRRAARCCSWA